MTTIHHIFHDQDLYEVHVRGSLIFSIVKYCGDSQLRRRIQYEDLTAKAQEAILNTISNNAKNT